MKLKYHPKVYEDAEDSWLLQRHLVAYLANQEQKTILDVGTGTGILAITAAKLGHKVVATDIDLTACKLARENCKNNKTDVFVINCDLEGGVKGPFDTSETRVSKRNQKQPFFDVAVFNPPYLPEDEFKTEIDRACIGGKTGIETFIRFAKNCLRLTEKVLFVYSSFDDVPTMLSELDKLGWKFSKLASENYGGEELCVGLLTLK